MDILREKLSDIENILWHLKHTHRFELSCNENELVLDIEHCVIEAITKMEDNTNESRNIISKILESERKYTNTPTK